MKISEIEKELKRIKADFGDIECLVKAEMDQVCVMLPIDELNVVEREGYGLSVSFI